MLRIVFITLLFLGGTDKFNSNQMPIKMETATFGGGCFWCTQSIFDEVNGVVSVLSGYSGGNTKNPTYDEVCSGTTGHAEVIQIQFNPDVVSYARLLEIFFKTHDPTTLNRQGADMGTQYRSVIFYHNVDQKHQAIETIEKLNEQKIWPNKIVTQVAPFTEFYVAEAYHQNYFENNPNQGYCRIVIEPKVEKFRKSFQPYLKKP